MAISKIDLEKILKTHFPSSSINIIDLAGDEDHYSLEITDKIFAGKSLLVQHRMVKRALSDALGTNLHAITIKTKSE